MGLLTGLLTLPVAPLRGTLWVAEKVLEQAESEYYDPGTIRRQMEQIDELRAAGDISEEDAEQAEEELLARLAEGRRRGIGRAGR